MNINLKNLLPAIKKIRILFSLNNLLTASATILAHSAPGAELCIILFYPSLAFTVVKAKLHWVFNNFAKSGVACSKNY